MPPINFIECKKNGYPARTKANIINSDCTIAFGLHFNTAGERLTARLCKELDKPYLRIDDFFIKTKDIATKIVSFLNELERKSIIINIAGNGIYSLDWHQCELDTFMCSLWAFIDGSENRTFRIDLVRSGGQTGFDEAGVKAAHHLGFATEIIAPCGWWFRTEDNIDVHEEQQFKARFAQTIKIK